MAGRNESFFHGTVHDIGVGRHVLPARASGVHNKPGSKGYAMQRSDRHAYASESEAKAWDFAETRSMTSRLKAGEQGFSHSPSSHRARVYEVAPHPMMRKGVYHADHPKHDPQSGDDREWIAPQYKVKAVHDIMPGRQGTFPSINWNQFSSVVGISDANHPSNDDLEMGHEPYQSPRRRQQVDDDIHAQMHPVKHEEVRGQLPLFPERENGGVHGGT